MLRYTAVSVFVFFSISSFAQIIAFPGAEGFGKYAVGGRGGAVYHVTNLNDSGPGSFRDGVGRPYRTIVFDIGGVIRIRNKIDVSSYLTIAGQTAPGKGITVYGDGISFSGDSNIIVRYIRFRGSSEMGRGSCTVSADHASDIIFDHVSIEWGRWDNLHIKKSQNITLQYCLVGEGINPQMFGALLESPVRLTIKNCLWINNQSRNPKAKAGIEFVNNVIYNWGSNGFVGGHSSADHFQDITANYFIAGPNSTGSFIGMFTATDHVFQKNNMVDLNRNGKLDGRPVTDGDFMEIGASILTTPSNSSPLVAVVSPAEAFRIVLKEAGGSLKRDAIDKRLINEVKSFGKRGKIIRTEAEAGGQDMTCYLPSKKARDTDGDGMPDRYEKKHGLDPDNAEDANINTEGSYTNLENFLNGLIRKNK